jgi:hypothetical protein
VSFPFIKVTLSIAAREDGNLNGGALLLEHRVEKSQILSNAK